MQIDRDDPGFDRVATLDIETTHLDAAEGELVSIGLGVHERGDPGAAASYALLHRDGAGEAALVRRAMDRLRAFDAGGLVSYNGRAFDLSFVAERLDRLGAAVPDPPVLDRHVDLFVDRQRAADRSGAAWPSLEDCLASYDLPRPRTDWRGDPITNTRFGDEVGPAYLAAVGGDGAPRDALVAAMDHYLRTDLEANLALYYADVGAAFEPVVLGSEHP